MSVTIKNSLEIKADAQVKPSPAGRVRRAGRDDPAGRFHLGDQRGGERLIRIWRSSELSELFRLSGIRLHLNQRRGCSRDTKQRTNPQGGRYYQSGCRSDL